MDCPREKKEIIVDGVDVSGCETYSKYRKGYCGWYIPCEGESCSYKIKWALEQLTKSEARVKELEEKNNHLVDINKTLERKLKIAEKALQYYADGEDIGEAKPQGSDAWRYVVDDNHTDIAQQALQKIKEIEVQNDN